MIFREAFYGVELPRLAVEVAEGRLPYTEITEAVRALAAAYDLDSDERYNVWDILPDLVVDAEDAYAAYAASLAGAQAEAMER